MQLRLRLQRDGPDRGVGRGRSMPPPGSATVLPSAPMTDCVTFDLAYVDAPEFEAVKVTAVMTPEHLTVQDLRGRMLMELDGVAWHEDPESNRRRFTYGEGADEVIIQKVDGCKCGGSSVTERHRISV